MTTTPARLDDPGTDPASDPVDDLAELLTAAALAGRDVGDLLGAACTEATRRLPRGMALTAARPGSWEATHVEGLTNPAAVDEGPGAIPLQVYCGRCGATPGDACWNPRTYADNKHPHRERVESAAQASYYDVQTGWWD